MLISLFFVVVIFGIINQKTLLTYLPLIIYLNKFATFFDFFLTLCHIIFVSYYELIIKHCKGFNPENVFMESSQIKKKKKNYQIKIYIFFLVSIKTCSCVCHKQGVFFILNARYLRLVFPHFLLLQRFMLVSWFRK